MLLATVLLFLIHATAAAVGHRIVWYGRLPRLYIPFIVLAGVNALSIMLCSRVAPQLALSSCVIAVISYVLFLKIYIHIVYPPDVTSNFKFACLPYGKVPYYNEVKGGDKLLYQEHSKKVAPVAHCPPNSRDSLTILVNLSLLYLLADSERRMPLPLRLRARVLFDAPLNCSFSVCKLEGL